MKPTRKAELSINMIVIVAISIVVLVIVIYLVIQQSQSTERGVSCPSLGGSCVPTNNCIPYESLDNDACRTGQVCCPLANVRLT